MSQLMLKSFEKQSVYRLAYYFDWLRQRMASEIYNCSEPV